MKAEEGIKAILFDMHGVVMVDPDENLPMFLRDYAKETDMQACVRAWLDASIGKISSQEMLSLLKVGDSPEHMQRLERELLDSIQVNPAFYEAADQLKNHFRLGLLSNDTAEWSVYLRAKFRLDPYFETVIVSGDVGMRKPEPEIFVYAAQQMGLSAPECLFIDDRIRNLKAAAELGMKTVLFAHGREEAPSTGDNGQSPSIWVEDDTEDMRAVRSFEDFLELLL